MSKNGAYKMAFVASIYDHLNGFHIPFMKLLQEKGCDVHAYARQDGTKETLEQEGVVCHDIPFRRNPFHKGNILSLRLLMDSFKTENFQMVHVHTPVAAVLGRIAAKKTSVPFVLYTAHGFHFYKGAPWHNWLLYYPLERFMARYTDILITINEEDYDRAKYFPVRDRVAYVPGVGLDISYYKPNKDEDVRKQLGIRPETFVITCVAELIKRKNHLQLIKAVKSMVAAGLDIQCLLLGEGERGEELKQQVKQMGLTSHVHFLGHRDDIPHILGVSDVSVLFSKHEGLPRSLMESMAAGVPIVASDIRGHHDLIEHERNGFLVPVGDVEKTVEALKKLYKYPELRAKMGDAVKKRVLQYDIACILPQMERIYQQGFEQWDQVERASALPGTV